MFTSGTITEVAHENQSGAKIAEITNLSAPPIYFDFYRTREPNLWQLFDWLLDTPTTIAGPANGDIRPQGDNIRTGSANDEVSTPAGDDFVIALMAALIYPFSELRGQRSAMH